MSSWNPLKPVYDVIGSINSLVTALDGLSAELRALRYAELDKVVSALKKPTDDVREELKHQS